MVHFKDLISKDRLQFQIYIGLSIIIFTFTVILYFSAEQIFKKFIGSINPLIVCSIIIIAGFILLSFQYSKGWFVTYKTNNFKKGWRAALPALLFVPVSILVDIQVGIWKDLNVMFPESLLFYPSIGFVV